MSRSTAEQALIALGARLRELRYTAGLSGRGLSGQCGWHGSKVSRIEHGKQVPTVDDIKAWCSHCNAEEHISELVASLHNYESLYTTWQRMERNGFRPLAANLNNLWEQTNHIRVYATSRVPGPIQTAAYVREVLCSLRDRRNVVDDVEQAVELRMARQRLLHRPGRAPSLSSSKKRRGVPASGAIRCMRSSWPVWWSSPLSPPCP